MSDKITTEDLRQRLRARFAYPEWALFEEVYKPTRQRGKRFADAMALNLWSTRGLEFHGFEIKVTRADWLRELRTPSKAEELGVYCDRWWLVLADRDIIKEGELPNLWGVMIPHGDGLRITTAAPKLPAEPLDRKLVSVLIRHFYEDNSKRKRDRADLDESYQKGLLWGQQSSKSELERAQKRYQETLDAIAAFEKVSGVRIDTWNAARIGDAVRLVMSDQHTLVKERLRSFRENLVRLVQSVDTALEGNL